VKYADKPGLPFNQLKIKSSFSLSEPTNYNSKGTVTVTEIAESPAPHITDKVVEQQDVLAAIKKFAGIKEAEGSRQLLTILTTAQLIFSESLIQLIVNNETQKEQFMVIRQSFTDWMRAELKNSSIGVDIKISETETQIKAYKPMDIFKAMSEKNPALLELKKRFDLEIDY
jgi:hypothetical protein